MSATYERLPEDWAELLSEATSAASYQQLQRWLAEERQRCVVYPPQEELFTAFHLCSLAELKVVILGQDPYHGEGQAHGLSFSVKPGLKIPPSLRNIYKELERELGAPHPQAQTSGELSAWARQGVLLLNTVMTVRAGEANSHRKQGWERFSDEVIRLISAHKEHVVFILWGRPAQQKRKLIDEDKHSVLMSAHPSPLSARNGFFGSAPFSSANAALSERGQALIDWRAD